MGSCLCKSTEDLAKVHISYPMNDLSSVFKDEKSTKAKSVKNYKYKKEKEISKHGNGTN